MVFMVYEVSGLYLCQQIITGGRYGMLIISLAPNTHDCLWFTRYQVGLCVNVITLVTPSGRLELVNRE